MSAEWEQKACSKKRIRPNAQHINVHVRWLCLDLLYRLLESFASSLGTWVIVAKEQCTAAHGCFFLLTLLTCAWSASSSTPAADGAAASVVVVTSTSPSASSYIPDSSASSYMMIGVRLQGGGGTVLYRGRQTHVQGNFVNFISWKLET